MTARYHRVLIKLSGAAVAGPRDFGFDPEALEHIAAEVLSVAEMGVEVAIVIGGGNIFRGNVGEAWGLERAEADTIGVLGTVINSLMLRSVLKAHGGQEVRVMTAVPMNAITEPFIRLKAIHHLEKSFIVILAGGTGQPFMTTDYPAVQRAIELRCDAIFAAKHGVDGIYNNDPKRDPSARRYRTIGYEDVVRDNLKVMDQSAFLLARDFGLPIHLFDFERRGAMAAILRGENPGTLIGPGTVADLE